MYIYHNHRDKRSHNETCINCQVGEPDEPSVTGTRLQLASAFRAANRSSRVLTTDTDTEQEAISGECRKHTIDATMSAIRAGSKSSKDELMNVSENSQKFGDAGHIPE